MRVIFVASVDSTSSLFSCISVFPISGSNELESLPTAPSEIVLDGVVLNTISVKKELFHHIDVVIIYTRTGLSINI